MNKRKSTPKPPRPVPRNGWIRKCDLDDYRDRHLPIPTQVVSNEEFIPMPQSRKQRAVEHHLLESATRTARHQGLDRRDFLRSACGMATAFMAINKVFGDFFLVQAAEAEEPGAAEAQRIEFFIFDVQTHHVAPGRAELGGAVTPLDLRRMGTSLNPDLAGREVHPEDLYLQNYIKEVFIDSETDIAAISGLPAATDDLNALPPGDMVRAREWINRITDSPRMVSHGLLVPDMGVAINRERMHMQAETLKVDAWKGYTGLGLGKNPDGWWLDDENIAYPALEYAHKLGVRNVCLHKGLSLGLFNEEHCHPRDLVRASKDFPDLNFLVYHSGFQSVEAALPAAESDFRTSSYVPWVSDLCEWRKANPHMRNVYMELGGTFAITAVSHPALCCHVLGMILDAFGEDHVLWGTDSIWLGSPQWQIEALRRLQMPGWLAERFGYAPLTTEVKRKIFGLNAARVYGVDPSARRNAVPGDYIDQLEALYRQAGVTQPSNTQYGWVRAPA